MRLASILDAVRKVHRLAERRAWERRRLGGSELTNLVRRPGTGTEMRSLYIASWVFVAVIVSVGCRGEPDPQGTSSSVVRTHLIEGFVSRQGAAEVEAKLRQGNAKVVVVEDGKSNEQRSSFRSPLSVRVLNVAGFTYLGFEGDLRLEFVDGELAATWFFPADVARFEVGIARQWPVATSGQPMRLDVATELRAGVDYRGKKYWAWEDVNLRQKVERWIKQNT